MGVGLRRSPISAAISMSAALAPAHRNRREEIVVVSIIAKYFEASKPESGDKNDELIRLARPMIQTSAHALTFVLGLADIC